MQPQRVPLLALPRSRSNIERYPPLNLLPEEGFELRGLYAPGVEANVAAQVAMPVGGRGDLDEQGLTTWTRREAGGTGLLRTHFDFLGIPGLKVVRRWLRPTLR